MRGLSPGTNQLVNQLVDNAGYQPLPGACPPSPDPSLVLSVSSSLFMCTRIISYLSLA
jgi:hypothetical protein